MLANQDSFTTKLIEIVVGHLVINIVTGVLFVGDDYSLIYQILHSVIHAWFTYRVVKHLYGTVQLNSVIEIVWLLTVVAFIFLNCIPFLQGIEIYDHPFVFYWETLPQIMYGWPNAFLRFVAVFSKDFVIVSEKTLIHFNLLVLNVYMLSVLLAIEYKVIKYMTKKLVEMGIIESHTEEEKI